MLYSRCALAALGCLFWSFAVYAQSYETQYSQSLEAVLKQLEARFGVTLRYNKELIKGRTVSFGNWRLRSDIRASLDNVLISNDLVWYKANDSTYDIAPYQYWQKPVEDGKNQLDTFLAAFGNRTAWEKRKAALRQCMLSTLRLQQLPPWSPTAPITTHKRMFDGYTVQNIALETLPGLFVCGSLYSPLNVRAKVPVILSPDGHFDGGRYRPDNQYRCASLARMGALVFSYDLFGWGESELQFKAEDHRSSIAMTIQVLNNFRVLDFLTSLNQADTTRVAITGASGGGSQAMLLTALTSRIKVSAPVVMLSAYFSGGCPCETGLPVHWCGGGTNNAEIAAMAAPRPQMVVSVGTDWTDHVPSIEFPYLQKMYSLYGSAGAVMNAHLAGEAHDYGFSKRKVVYAFMAEQLGLDITKIQNKEGESDESFCTIEEPHQLYVFGKKGERLPARSIHSMAALQMLLNKWLSFER